MKCRSDTKKGEEGTVAREVEGGEEVGKGEGKEDWVGMGGEGQVLCNDNQKGSGLRRL